MRIYAMAGIIFVLLFAVWKIYDHGYESASIKNQLAAVVALREAEAEAVQLASQERERRIEAEDMAETVIAHNEQLAEHVEILGSSEECPDICYSVSWPSD